MSRSPRISPRCPRRASRWCHRRPPPVAPPGNGMPMERRLVHLVHFGNLASPIFLFGNSVFFHGIASYEKRIIGFLFVGHMGSILVNSQFDNLHTHVFYKGHQITIVVRSLKQPATLPVSFGTWLRYVVDISNCIPQMDPLFSCLPFALICIFPTNPWIWAVYHERLGRHHHLVNLLTSGVFCQISIDVAAYPQFYASTRHKTTLSDQFTTHRTSIT